MLIAVVIASLNPVSLIILQKLAVIARKKTMPEETYRAMMGTLITQYLNIAVVIFLVNFKFEDIERYPAIANFVKDLPFFNGKYEEFTIEWYQKVGTAIGMTVFMQVLVPQLRNAFPYLIFELRRFVDRGCRNGSKTTKQVTQEDYNNLYTGKEYNIAYSYATLHTIIWVTLTFSSAMPILYPIAFLYNLVTYWMDKYLMLNFYRKSITFNEYVPMQTLSLFKYPLIMHGVVAVYMMSNLQIFYSEADQDSEEARAGSFNNDVSYYAQQFRTNLDERLNHSHITLLIFFYTVLGICYLARESI